MAIKYLSFLTGVQTWVSTVIASAGAADSGKMVGLDSTGRVDKSILPIGVAPEVDTLIISEDIADGDLLNLYSNGGVSNFRKADATTNKPATHFALASATSNGTNTIDGYRISQSNTHLTGLTVGAAYYLSKTAGGVTTDVSAYVDGNIIQEVGIAVNATTLLFMPKLGIHLGA